MHGKKTKVCVNNGQMTGTLANATASRMDHFFLWLYMVLDWPLAIDCKVVRPTWLFVVSALVKQWLLVDLQAISCLVHPSTPVETSGHTITQAFNDKCRNTLQACQSEGVAFIPLLFVRRRRWGSSWYEEKLPCLQTEFPPILPLVLMAFSEHSSPKYNTVMLNVASFQKVRLCHNNSGDQYWSLWNHWTSWRSGPCPHSACEPL